MEPAYKPVFDISSSTLKARAFLLTYAQAAKHKLTKEKVAVFLGEKEAEAYWVAQETHMDGQPHIHAIVQFKKAKTIRVASYFNIGTAHPNIAMITPGTTQKVMEYITKEDKSPIKYGELATEKAKRGLITAVEASKLSDIEIAALVPAIHLERVIGAKRLYLAALESQDNDLPVAKPGDIDLPLYKDGPVTINWTNVADKKRHLWIHGPSNTGKTSFANKLKSMFKTIAASFHPPFWYMEEGKDRKTSIFIVDDTEIPTWTGLKSILPGIKTSTYLSLKGSKWVIPSESWFILCTNEPPYPGLAGIKREEITNRFFIVDTANISMVRYCDEQ